MPVLIEFFEDYRNLLFSIAYRMLGSVMEAEDAVQEAYLRFMSVDAEDDIVSYRAYLTTIITRICLDQLKSARVQREQYFGPWLPEPLETEDEPSVVLQSRETITLAFLTLLEKLPPVERAAFLLREVFDYEYADIAQIVEKSEANCRQLVSRAKKHLVENRPRLDTPQDVQRRLLARFMAAVNEGDEAPLVQMLSEDVQLWSDGGGKVTAAIHPLFGPAKVAAFFAGLGRKRPPNTEIQFRDYNGAPGIAIYIDGKLDTVMNFLIADDQIYDIRAVRNPDKLRHL